MVLGIFLFWPVLAYSVVDDRAKVCSGPVGVLYHARDLLVRRLFAWIGPASNGVPQTIIGKFRY